MSVYLSGLEQCLVRMEACLGTAAGPTQFFIVWEIGIMVTKPRACIRRPHWLDFG